MIAALDSLILSRRQSHFSSELIPLTFHTKIFQSLVLPIENFGEKRSRRSRNNQKKKEKRPK